MSFKIERFIVALSSRDLNFQSFLYCAIKSSERDYTYDE